MSQEEISTMPGVGLDHEDVTEIERLIVEFVWRVDHQSADTVHELFVEDGELTWGGNPMRGRSEIIEWGSKRAGQEGQSLHVCSNIRVVPTGPDRVQVTTYMLAYMRDPGRPAPEGPVGMGEYDDELVKQNGQWFFTKRRVILLGSR
jgi:hypothetical protein